MGSPLEPVVVSSLQFRNNGLEFRLHERNNWVGFRVIHMHMLISHSPMVFGFLVDLMDLMEQHMFVSRFGAFCLMFVTRLTAECCELQSNTCLHMYTYA